MYFNASLNKLFLERMAVAYTSVDYTGQSDSLD